MSFRDREFLIVELYSSSTFLKIGLMELKDNYMRNSETIQVDHGKSLLNDIVDERKESLDITMSM